MDFGTRTKTVTLRCDDGAEALVFARYVFHDGEVNYEITVEDAYTGGEYNGFIGRIKRAWKAFWAKPVTYTGVYVENKDRILSFLNKCLELVTGGGDTSDT